MSEGFSFLLIATGMILFFLVLFVGALVLHRRIIARREREYRELAMKQGLTYIGDDDSFLASYQHLQTLGDDGFASWVSELLSGEIGCARVHLFQAAYNTGGGGSPGRFVPYTMCLIEHSELEYSKRTFTPNDRAIDVPQASNERIRSIQQALSEWNGEHRAANLRAEVKKGLLLLSIRKHLSASQAQKLLELVQRIIDDLS